MNPLEIIDKYYASNPQGRDILLAHSEAVAGFALQCAAAHPELNLDSEFIYNAAMLHDIGIFMTHAPGIFCFGELPYIAHGIAGEILLRKEGLPEYGRVAGRHTGSGLTSREIIDGNLPIPPFDMLPESLEEKLVCYADKFFSKNPVLSPDLDLTPLAEIKPLSKVRTQMASFGPLSASRFDSLHSLFS